MNLFTKMIEEIKTSGLPTILYGSGAVSGMVNEYLGKNGIDPAGYAVDREYYKGVDTFRGKPLYISSRIISRKTPATSFWRFRSFPLIGRISFVTL